MMHFGSYVMFLGTLVHVNFKYKTICYQIEYSVCDVTNMTKIENCMLKTTPFVNSKTSNLTKNFLS